MPELRWVLLGLGVLFVLVLALIESRRQRRLPPQVEEPTQHRFREHTLGLPEVRPREAVHELPVVEFDESMIGLRVDGVRIEQDLVAVDVPAIDPPPIIAAPRDVPLSDAGFYAQERAPEPETDLDREPALDSTHELEARADELPQEYSAPAAGATDAVPCEPSAEPQWSPQEQRRLLSLRLVPRSGERFTGRALRLALTAEGFAHGKYAIFHRSSAEDQVVVSAASLTKPGCFELQSMDSQRYGGLGLFTVLPGHLPASDMFDELIESAQRLTERLGGALLDESGEPLDAQSIGELRARINTVQLPTLALDEASGADAHS